MKIAYLSLGSNLGDRQRYLLDAIEQLQSATILVLQRSSIFETEPRDVAAQPWFLNMAVKVETALFPLQLLSAVLKIERTLGRVRTVPSGPRTIDIDILLYGRFVITTERLVIPHPRMKERRFVLEPLAELEPSLVLSGDRRTIAELLEGVRDQPLRKWLGTGQQR